MLSLAEGDCLLGSQIVPHDFHEQLTTTARFRRQPLADDVAQDIRQADAQLLLFARVNIPRMRLIDWPASTVWSVLRTRWPVSDAIKAISTVARSRISPTRMTFGAWRNAARRPLA